MRQITSFGALLLFVTCMTCKCKRSKALRGLSFIRRSTRNIASYGVDNHLPRNKKSETWNFFDASHDLVLVGCKTRILSKTSSGTLSGSKLFMAKSGQRSESVSFLRQAVYNPSKSLTFTALITVCGAMLGPFLDSYHSAFGVLRYDDEITFVLPFLGGTTEHPALTTSWWVPELFGLAGFIIGWLYILLDDVFLLRGGDEVQMDGLSEKKNEKSDDKATKLEPRPPVILAGISCFTFQYYLSGVLFQMGLGRSIILNVMSIFAAAGFLFFDNTISGFIVSAATSVGGPLIEVGLITFLKDTGYGYHYTDSGETGFFPLWIMPVYFLGGPAVGNLARGIWNSLDGSTSAPEVHPDANEKSHRSPNCSVCNDTRCVGCPNCDARGFYITYNRKVTCNCCKGRGFVICRSCFQNYGDDPSDIERIRDIMSRMPD